MLRRLAQFLLLKPVVWMANKFSSRPDPGRIGEALESLLTEISKGNKDKGLLIPFNLDTGRFIIFSDQHKGARNGADDFMNAESSYLAALKHYREAGFHFINLGDAEELWENTWLAVKKYNKATFEAEAAYIPANAYVKIFGNHDLLWDNDPFAPMYLKDVYKHEVPIYEAVVLTTTIDNQPLRIFCTHGHQGDAQSDGNWFSKFFVARIWAPLQSYLRINPNTPAYDASLKTRHNEIMYQWSSRQQDLLLITGHTHQPVFESLTHLERLYRELLTARQGNDIDIQKKVEDEITVRRQPFDSVSDNYLQLRPTYFNSGCCCFSDGDITGIEIEDGMIRLIKWKLVDGTPARAVLEEMKLADIARLIRK